MVTLLKKYGREDCLKTIQIVDEEALETAHLAGEITDDQLLSLQTTSHSLYVR